MARRFSELLCRDRDTVLDVVQLETGKARIDAVFELGEAVMSTAQHARTAAALLGRRHHRGMLRGMSTAQEIRHPKGVVSVIIPWNFPLALAVADALPALIAGNAVILKPDNQTALSALLLSRLLREAGLPSSVFQVLPGPVEDIGDVVIAEADYAAFTGSTDTGRRIGAKAGSALVGCSLELGGKNPMIVLADADLDRVIAALPQAVCLNAGQVCMAIERIYVHSSRYEEIISRAVDRFAALRLGFALDFSTDVGSLTSRAVVERVHTYVEDARAAGATVLTGGRARPDLGPYLFEPTLLADVPDRALLTRDEVFGPVCAVYPFDDEADAVELANDTEYGLIASVWTTDTARGARLAEQIAAGAVNINDACTAAFSAQSAPMGGMKASGLGRRHGQAGLLRYTESQTVAIQRVPVTTTRFGLPRGPYGRLTAASLGLLRVVAGR